MITVSSELITETNSSANVDRSAEDATPDRDRNNIDSFGINHL